MGSPEPQDDADAEDRDGHRPALALSPDGLTAAVGIDRGIQLVDLRTGAVRTATGDLTGSTDWVLFSPDGKTVVSTNLDKTVTRWDVESATPLETLRGHSNSVSAAGLQPRREDALHGESRRHRDRLGSQRATAGSGGPSRSRTTEGSATGYDGHPGKFSPDGRLIAVGLKERGIALWDARELTPVGAPLLETGGEVKTLAFTPDGRTLAAVTEAGMADALGCRFAIAAPWAAQRGLDDVGVSRASARTGRCSPRPASDRREALGRRDRSRRCGRIGDGSYAGDVAFSPTGPLVAFVVAGYLRSGRRRRRGLGCGQALAGHDAARRRAAGRPRLGRRPQPRRPLARGRRLGDRRTPLGRPRPEARPRARPDGGRRVLARVQPGRPDPRHLRLASPSRLSGTLRPEPRSARSSPPATAGR